MKKLKMVLMLSVFLVCACAHSTKIPWVQDTGRGGEITIKLPKDMPDLMTLNKRSQGQISEYLCFLTGEDDKGNAYALITFCSEPLCLGFIYNKINEVESKFYIFTEYGETPIKATIEEFDEFLSEHDPSYRGMLEWQKREKLKNEKRVSY